MISLFIIVYIFSLPALLNTEILSLNGEKWNVRNENGEIQATAEVPGGIYSDLSKVEGLLPEDYLSGFNDINYRWVSNHNWTYSLKFDVPENIFPQDFINLVFHGIDTISTIWLNGDQIGETDNMFRRYNFNVKNILKAYDNQLEVRLIAPAAEAKRRYDVSDHPIPPSSISTSYHGESFVQMLRKMQCSFAWDWGPAFPSAGIWKDIELISYNPLEIRDIYWRSYNNGKAFEYTIYLETDQDASFDSENLGHVKVILKDPISSTNIYEEILEVERSMLSKGEIKLTRAIESIPEIKLWWPNGFGDQFLYEFTVNYSKPNEKSSIKSINVGFRTIELIQTPVILENNQQAGATFYFRVNGVDIFVKGANWIPADVLPENQKDNIEWLLTSAKQAHMNMLRVWGGGVYESDEFYQLADKLGILIWQDLMYAVYLYPATQDFISSAMVEAKQQIRRLQHHSSIAIWAGNNELESAIVSKWYPEQTPYDEILRSDYRKLFAESLSQVAGEEDPYRPFVVSSPSNGDDTLQHQGIADNPSDSKWGDVHFYQYVVDGCLVDNYPTPRFASEYGYQSLPEITSWRAVAQESELSLGSDLLKHREHSPLGLAPLLLQTRYQIPLPTEQDVLLPLNFERIIYASQIYQALSYKIETEHYRNHQSLINEIGEGRTMGALYWQLNDVWIAPSWAGIDKFGRWKIAHYYAVDFYSPYLATAEIDSSDTIRLYLISDLLENQSDVKFEISIYKWNDFNPIYTKISSETLNYTSSIQILKSSIIDLINPAGCINKEDCFIKLKLQPTNYSEQNNFVFLAPLKNSFPQIPTPQLKATILTGPENATSLEGTQKVYTIQVTTDTPAYFTWLSFTDVHIKGRFSENGFHLLQNKKLINFYTDLTTSKEELENLLTIYSFKDKLNLE